ncbi:MAG: hypothetical protein GWN37_10450 [Gammaproteobacteria bacterium]|nr:hypothetical protein [Gammaproteobacteria bacterium]
MRAATLARFALPFLLLLLVAACASYQSRERAIQFEETLRTYRKAIRWSEFDAAYATVQTREDDLELGEPDFEFLDAIRVTSYEITSQRISPDETEIKVSAEIDFYHENSPTVRHLTDQQLWWYEPEEKRWFLSTGLPDFKRAMR